MASEYLNLPGGCFVNEIANNLNGLTLNPDLLTAYGFEPNQPATMLIRHGQIIITTEPTQCNIISGIEELQLRQDELQQDFEPAILGLLSLFQMKN